MKHTYSLPNVVTLYLLLIFLFAGSAASALEPSEIRFVEPTRTCLRSHCGGLTFSSDVQPWLAKCENRIRQAGFVGKDFVGKKIKIQIVLSKVQSEAAIGTLTLVHSSGSKLTDKAALRIIQYAAPFEGPTFEWPVNRVMFVEMEYPKLELKFAPTKKDRDYLPWQIDPFVPATHSQPCNPFQS